MWSKDYKECQECGSSETPHHAKGLCKACYLKAYREPEPVIDKINPRGIGLYEIKEWGYIDKLAEDMGDSVTSHAIGKYLLRWAIAEHKKGNVKIATKKQIKLDFPE